MAKLTRDFFDRDTVTVARELVGTYLVRVWQGERLVCRLTETEAYVGPIDKGCHAYQYRRTARTEPLFAAPGHTYVYLIYGMYHCLNLVTEPEGEPCAVLLRGGSPRLGGETISHLRYGKPLRELTAYQRKNFLNGPGKLCRGLALTREHNLIDITASDELYLVSSLTDLGLEEEPAPGPIQVGKRIGIDYAEEAADFPWRFWTENRPV